MNKKLSSILKYVLGLGLGFGLLYLALSDFEFSELQEKLENANLYLILLALVVALASHFFRAARWKMMLKASNHDAPLLNTYAALMVGYMVNQALPRGGEVARCTMLLRSDNVPVSTSVGTVVTERVFDLLVLLILIATFGLIELEKALSFPETILAEVERYGADQPQPSDGSGIPWLYIFGGIAVLGMALFLVFRKKIMATAIGQKAKAFLLDTFQAAKSVTRLERPWMFFVHTILIWVCYGIMTALPVMALDSGNELDMNIWYFGFILMVMGGLGMAMPVPGGIGPYHFSVLITFLVFFGEGMREMGQSVAILIHSTQVIMLVGTGFISWLYLVAVGKRSKPEDSDVIPSES